MVQAMVWPIAILVIVVVFFVLFRRPVGTFISKVQDVNIKGPGLTVQVSAQVVGMLSAATAKPGGRDGSEAQEATSVMDQIKDIAGIANQIVTPRSIRRLSDANVLWVDDRPQNNVYERGALEALGVGFTISLSTDDAIAKLRSKTFDVIISDMGRPPDQRAGYTLLDQLRASGNQTPFVIYAGSNLPEHKAMAREHGAQGSTNRPQELFQLVVGLIGGSSS